MPIKFSDNGWDDYLYWQAPDKKTLRRINELLQAVQREPFQGIGKPEALRYQLAGFWSRRIDDRHRLVYCLEQGTVIVVACRDHY